MSQPAPQDAKPESLTLDLEWLGDNRLRGRSGALEIVMDSPPEAGPSPVQTLAFALAGCMAIDVVQVLTKGRLPLDALRAHVAGERADQEPRRLVRVDLHFVVTGEIPSDRVERAIALSREKYCSVWHSLRPDIEFLTSFEILGSSAA